MAKAHKISSKSSKATKAGSAAAKRINNAEPRRVLTSLSTWLPYLLLSIVVFLVYAQTLQKGYGFVGFDDQVFMGNPAFSRWEDFWSQFTLSASTEAYRPLFFGTIVLNALVFGQTSAFGFHFVNVLFHAIASCLVFAIVVRLNYDRMLALLLALIFAVHPVLVQAVAWIPGRNDSFVAMWLFGSFVALVAYIDRRRAADRSAPVLLAVHFVLFILGTLSKETAVVFPAVCVLYLWLIAGVRLFSPFMLACVGVWALIDAAYLYLRVNVPAVLISQSYQFKYSYGLEALMADWRAIPEFVGKMVIPVNLSGYSMYTTLSTTIGLVVMALLIGGVVFVLRSVKSIRWQYITLGGLWALLFLVLPLMRHQFHTNPNEQDYLEHRSYIPLVGLLIVIAEVLRYVMSPSGATLPAPQAASKMRRRVAAALVSVAVVFAFITISYVPQFRDGLTFWQAVMKYNPNSALAWNSVGYFMMEAGMPPDQVAPYMEKAVELAPTDVRFLNGMAVIHLRQNKVQQAEEEFRKGAQMDSTFADVLYNLGYVIQSTRPNRSGVPEAKKLYEQAIRNNPAHYNSYLNLAITSLEEGNVKRARELYLEAKKNGLDLTQNRPELVPYLTTDNPPPLPNVQVAPPNQTQQQQTSTPLPASSTQNK